MSNNGLIIENILCEFYFQDYHWWWRSFLTSGFTSFYLCVYCVHYFMTKLEIEGAASTFLYFGYTSIIVFTFFILTGMFLSATAQRKLLRIEFVVLVVLHLVKNRAISRQILLFFAKSKNHLISSKCFSQESSQLGNDKNLDNPSY